MYIIINETIVVGNKTKLSNFKIYFMLRENLKY